MLAKAKRLDRKQFAEFFKVGKRFHHAALTIVYVKQPFLMASVVVSKKVQKQAVGRNTIRRQLYGCIEDFVQNRKNAGVYIIITKPSFALMNRKERRQAVMDTLALTADPG